MVDDCVRYAVAKRRSDPKPFVLRVFGDDPTIFTSFGPYTLENGVYRSSSLRNGVRIISVHESRAEAAEGCS